MAARADPTQMGEFTAPMWAHIVAEGEASHGRVADSVLGLLRSMSTLVEGYPVDQLTHACQTASRVERDGATTEQVVTALCHDVGKAISWRNHGPISAEILRPYVADDLYQVVRVHQDFQLRHFAHHLGGDPTARDRHRAEPWFEFAERFTDVWDQLSFDPDYDTFPLEHFETRLRAVFHRPRSDS